MSDKAAANGTGYDGILWCVVVALVAAGVWGNSYFASESALLRTIVLLVVAGVAGFLASRTAKGHAAWTLGKEARTEIRKVVWPTRQETTHTTLIVVLVVLVVALLLWGLDSFLSWIISMIIG